MVETALGNPPEEKDLAPYPILVFDQNGKDIYQSNTVYLTDLSKATKVKFIQVSMAHALKIAATLKIQDYFDATGDGNAGYGGCRNIVFLLGPMLFCALKNGVASSADAFADLSESNLKPLLKKTLDNEDGLMVLMGDDDTTLLPGFLHAKALLAGCEPQAPTVEHSVQVTQSNSIKPRVPCYAKIAQRTGGPVYARVPPAPIRYYDLADDYEQKIFRGMRAACWDRAKLDEMAGMLCHPGACLPLTWPRGGALLVFEHFRDALLLHPSPRRPVQSSQRAIHRYGLLLPGRQLRAGSLLEE